MIYLKLKLQTKKKRQLIKGSQQKNRSLFGDNLCIVVMILLVILD